MIQTRGWFGLGLAITIRPWDAGLRRIRFYVDGGQANLCLYVGNDPVNWSDPSGPEPQGCETQRERFGAAAAHAVEAQQKAKSARDYDKMRQQTAGDMSGGSQNRHQLVGGAMAKLLALKVMAEASRAAQQVEDAVTLAEDAMEDWNQCMSAHGASCQPLPTD